MVLRNARGPRGPRIVSTGEAALVLARDGDLLPENPDLDTGLDLTARFALS